MKLDDSYFENMILNQEYFTETYSSEKNTMEEFLTRTKRDALYQKTFSW